MKYTIKNIAGIDCIFVPMMDSSSVTVEVFAKAGSLYEEQKNNWLSHFLEHMFFKWGKRYPTPIDVVRASDEIGAYMNAATATEYACYFVKTSPERTEKSLDILSDMMLNATFPVEEIDKERFVILEEMKRKHDMPTAALAKIWKRNYYWDNPYWWDILGTKENLLWFMQDDFLTHKEKLYTKNNICIVVAGNITDQNTVEAQIAQQFWQLPSNTNSTAAQYVSNHPLGKTDTIERWLEQSHIVFGAPWVSELDKKIYQYALLGNIIWWMRSSRLYQEIREKRWLAYDIYCTHRGEKEHWRFIIGAWLAKEKSEEWIKVIKDILYDFSQGNIDESEFEKAKKNRVGSLQLALETSDEVAEFFGIQHLVNWKIDTIEDEVAGFNKVTLEEIKAIASVVHPDNFYGCIMQ